MDDELRGVYDARISVLEMMVTLLLTEASKQEPGDPAANIERYRTLFWSVTPGKPDFNRADTPYLHAFHREWQHRVDQIFDDAAKLVR